MSEGVDLAALHRSSVRAGLVSLVGVLIVFSGIGLSLYRLVGLQDEIAALAPVRERLRQDNEALSRARDDLQRDNEVLVTARAELVAARDALSEERLKLETEIDGLRAERDRLRESMVEVSSLLDSSAGGSATAPRIPESALKSVRRRLEVAVPTTARVRPRAAMSEAGKGLVDFSIWLEMPVSVAEQIERVTYVFNHPSFREQNQTVTEREGGFRVSYRGWGCLDSVVVTLQSKTGEREKMVFDMCALLSRAGSTVAPEPAPEVRPGVPLDVMKPGRGELGAVGPGDAGQGDAGQGEAGQGEAARDHAEQDKGGLLGPLKRPEGPVLPAPPEPGLPRATKVPIRPGLPLPDKRVP